MSHSRYRILWIVGCLLFVMLVAGCTAVQRDVEPPADLKVEPEDTTTHSELSDLTIAEEVEEEAAQDTAQTVIDMLKANLTSESLTALDYSVPSYNLPDCSFSLEEPIELVYLDEGHSSLVDEVLHYPYADTWATFDHVELISSNELLVSGRITDKEWVGVFDLSSKQFEILYESKYADIRDAQWSHQHNGIFFIEHGNQLRFLHRYLVDAPQLLYENSEVHELEIADQGQRLLLVVGDSDRFSLSVDTTSQGDLQKLVDIPIGTTTWSPNRNFLLTKQAHRSSETTLRNSLLHDLTNKTSCVVKLNVPGVVAKLDFERTISGAVSWTSDERYAVFSTKADFNFRTKETIVADMEMDTLKAISLDDPNLHISNIVFLSDDGLIAMASIFDRSNEEPSSMYFIDFEKQAYWKVSSKFVPLTMNFTSLEEANQLIYVCSQSDGKSDALCHATIEQAP